MAVKKAVKKVASKLKKAPAKPASKAAKATPDKMDLLKLDDIEPLRCQLDSDRFIRARLVES